MNVTTVNILSRETEWDEEKICVYKHVTLRLIRFSLKPMQINTQLVFFKYKHATSSKVR